MAINKRKVLDAARKFAQKGAKQKALKEYNKLVQADPRDAKLLLEIGDAYRRWGQAEEAIAQYTKVSNQYKQDGFDARAVAVLKQILNLDPKRYTAHVSLAELYQRMGLDSEAISALQTAADGYYRDGRRREALELLRKMAALDPSNTTSRLKVADLLRQEGMQTDAIHEYEAVASELVRQGAMEQATVVQERILEIQPDRVDVLFALAQALCDMGRPERAEPFALRTLERAREPDHFELLGGIYRSLGNDARLAEVTRELASYYRERGDDVRAREVMQRLPSESVLASGGVEGDLSEVEEEGLLGDDELLDDEFLMADEDFALPQDQHSLADRRPRGAADTTDAIEEEPESEEEPEGAEETEVDGDPDQLFAEASVYLRYGKRDQAIASLKAVLRQEPAHRGALEKLGEAHAESGDTDEAVACWLQAAELASGESDGDAYGILRDRIAALDAEAADGLEPLESDPEDSPQAEADLELDLGVEAPPETEVQADGESAQSALDDDLGLDFDVDIDGGGEAAEPAPESAAAEHGVDEEFELDLGDDVDAGAAAEVEAAARPDALELDVDLDGGAETPHEEFEIDVDETAPVEADASDAGAGQSSSTAAQIDEDLEEAEFYRQQGLDDEAEAVYRRIMSVAPNHPVALLKLGELAAARGEDPAAVAQPAADAAPRRGGAAARGSEAPEDADVDLDAAFEEAAAELDREAQGPGEDDVAALIAAAEAAVDAAESDSADDALEHDLDISVEDELDVATGADFDVATGAEPDVAVEAEPDVAAEAELDLASEAELDLATGAEPDLFAEGDEAQAAVADAGPPPGDLEGFEDLIGEDSTEVETLGPPAQEPASEPAQAEPFFTDDTLPIDEGADGDATTERLEAGAAGDDEDRFDLREALSGLFEESEEATDPNSTSQSRRSTVEDGFESLFADFKKGVSATLEAGDFDTRFDLGIAYREMGLFEDAIAEFKVCLDSPTRRSESLHMMGLCAFDLGRPADAVNNFEQALSTPDLEASQRAALQFDLGRSQRAAGDVERSRAAFDTVLSLDPAFPGVSKQLELLDSGAADGPLLLEQEAEQFESFDDLMSEVDDARETASGGAAESFESFDDVITEVEATVEAEPERVPEPEPAPPPDPKARPARKRKKISFV